MPSPAPDMPEITFNHLYVVLDHKTYRSIIHSHYLQSAFSGMELRSTRTAAGETWSGAYYYCQDTYLEFFGSGGSPLTGAPARSGHWHPGAQEGWAGLAFTVNRQGGAAHAALALHERFHYNPTVTLRQLQLGETAIPWFTMVRLAERLGLGTFDAWLMEYRPEIFTHKGISLPPGGALTTRAYLSPWNRPRSPSPPAAAQKEARQNTAARRPGIDQQSGSTPGLPTMPPVFSAVTGATVHMDEKRAIRFAETLSLFGGAQKTLPGGIEVSIAGFSLRILPEQNAAHGYRLSSIRLALARPSVAPMTFVFAPRSRLVLAEDQTAEWFFGV
jgi:hypothetical protein